MPSDEGLSTDQMCQALQALRVSPHLVRAQHFRTGRAYVFSALRSHFAPVLIISNEKNPNQRHAVTAVGQRLAPLRTAAPNDPVDASEGLLALYVNDDRVGPYLRVNVIERNNRLLLETVRHGRTLDRWFLDFVLLPLHPKIRLSISNLREICIRFVTDLHDQLEALNGPIYFEHWFARTPRYLKDLVSRSTEPVWLVDQIGEALKLPRYLGVARITGPRIGRIDLLWDKPRFADDRKPAAESCVPSFASGSLRLPSPVGLRPGAHDATMECSWSRDVACRPKRYTSGDTWPRFAP
jgi:hypothetical protein